MSRQTLLIVGAILVILVVLVTWAVFQPPAAAPKVTVSFAGYTNGSTGSRLAAFTVSNAGPSATLRLSHYRIQIPTATRWTNLSDGWVSGGGTVLSAGTSERITVPAATNQPWRVSLSVSPEVGVIGDAMGWFAETARSVGMRARYRKSSFGVQCDWIAE